VLEAAAANNAAWCHAFCRAHGILGTFTPDAWVSRARTPPLYPDAVTLRAGADADHVLAAVDDGAGCSVKDSFADLDLDGRGFRPLLHASWFRFDGMRERRPGWRPVAGASELAAWEAAWSGAEAAEFFPPSLLEDESISVLACFADGAIVAGAIASRGAGVTGITNAFGGDAWGAAAALAHPDEPVVCWEEEAPPSSVRLGDLVVWLRD
jgi:hypothetical protein